MLRLENLISDVRRTARDRNSVYGILPPPFIAQVTELTPDRMSLFGRLRLLWYLWAGGLRITLFLTWHYLIDRDTPKRRRKVRLFKLKLGEILSEDARVVAGYFERRNYARDLAPLPFLLEKILLRTTPTIVFQPKTETDIQKALAFAYEQKLPVTPRGVSSSAFGGAVPTCDGIVPDFSAYRGITGFDAEAMTVSAMAGTRWAELAEFLEPKGLAMPTNPTSRFSTIGGWAATGGLGLHGYKYGDFKESIHSFRLALPGGREVKTVTRQDTLFPLVIGTEGQLGLITELTLRAKPLSDFSEPLLFGFNTPKEAFRFIDWVDQKGITPSHLAFFDQERMKEENLLFFDRTPHKEPVVPEKDTVLLHFDHEKELERFRNAIGSDIQENEVAGPAGRYLWAERYFPLKGQRIGPNLLAAELVLEPGKLDGFLAGANKLAARFGISLAAEAIISRVKGKRTCVLIASFPADKNSAADYYLKLLFVQLLILKGVQRGGRPYGIGIWNAPFLATHYTDQQRKELLRTKRNLDPDNLFNPGKFFGVRSWFFNLLGWMFFSRVMIPLLSIAAGLSPVIGFFARRFAADANTQWRVPEPKEDEGLSLLSQSEQRCTRCGSCIAVCPAYVLTGDELVTARTKLALSQSILDGEPVSEREAFSSFQCIRCGLCEEVCQTRLPLRDCYDKIEDIALLHFKKQPDEIVANFIRMIDEKKDWINSTFGLDQADWSPPGMTPKLPPANRDKTRTDR